MRYVMLLMIMAWSGVAMSQTGIGVVYRGGSGDGFDYTRVAAEIYIGPELAESCPGDTVEIRLLVREGVGPWLVTLAPADIPTFRLYSRDTTFRLVPRNGSLYRITQIKDLGDQTQGIPFGAVRMNVHEEVVQFMPMNDNRIAHCLDINLFDKLRPRLGDVFVRTGDFQVGQQTGVTVWHPADVLAGDYTVSYNYRDDIGCESATAVVLTVDALPSLRMASENKNLCDGETGELKVEAVGNEVSFDLWRERQNENGVMGASQRTRLDSIDGSYREKISFLPEDRWLAYRVENVTDRYGCAPEVEVQSDGKTKLVLKDTVYHRRRPEMQVEMLYPKGGSWSALAPEVWTWGDTVSVRLTPLAGTSPWTVSMGMEKNPVERDITSATVEGYKREGLYAFSISDRYCSNDEQQAMKIAHKRPAYLRMKALLAAEYESGRMRERVPVTVELRAVERAAGVASAGEMVARESFFLTPEGMLVDGEGNTPIRFAEYGVKEKPDSCFVVLRSDRSLGVMSSRPCLLGDDIRKVAFVNLTDSANVWQESGLLSDHMSRVDFDDGGGVWALSGLDMNRNEVMTVRDQNLLRLENPVALELKLKATRTNRDKYEE